MRIPRVFLVLLCAITASGCGGSEYEGLTRFPLTGKVTLDGQPVAGGTITFIPQEIEHRPAGGQIIDGQYSVTAEQGANAGPYRVEIRWLKPTGKQVLDAQDTGQMVDEVAEAIPAKYNDNSELTATVSETETMFDFELQSQ